LEGARWFEDGGEGKHLRQAQRLLERASASPWPYSAPAYIGLAAAKAAAAGTEAALWARAAWGATGG